MRAALVIYGSLDTVSGGYLYDRMLVSKLRQRGDEVQILSQRRRPYAFSMLDNFSRPALPPIDVVIQDELNHPSLFIANHRSRHAPVVSIVHHLRSSEHRPAWQNAVYARIEREYLDSVDGFIFNSETTRATVRELVADEKPSVVATPGGDRLGSATLAHVQRRLVQPRTLRLVTVGSVIPSKGLDVILDAISRLRGEAVQLDVIGPEDAAPDFSARMRRRAAAMGMPIRFHGALSDEALKARLLDSDVFVLPSRNEGFGIAYLEAMAQGLPCIGAAAGAVPKLIQDGSNGYIVEPGNADQVACCIRTLAQDKDLLLRLSTIALKSSKALPTWDESTERMRTFLLSMVLAPLKPTRIGRRFRSP